MNVDAFRQDAVVEDHKLTVWILAPSIERVEELLTVDLSLVHISTILAGDVEYIITLLMEEVKNSCLGKQIKHDLATRSSN